MPKKDLSLNPVILETTLRDGSYAVNFSFTAHDTARICAQLERVGFDFIEIGHGVGLSASSSGHGIAAASDEEYMQAAGSALRKAKFGMFCIPGIASLEDLELARKHKMGFIRIGTNVDKIESSERFIKVAKDYGMFVFANFMKSYALPPREFAKKVRLSEKYGADVVYVVDSAGGMLPETLASYYRAIRQVTNIPLGFHGHNNLGLAIYNTFEAARLGFKFIDSSLQGLGRSSGNACTEILVALLKKAGYPVKINFLALLKLGLEYVQPLVSRKGEMPLDIVSGYAEFHSSYMPLILKCAAKYQVEPEDLIIEACKINKVEVDPELLDKMAKKMKRNRHLYIAKYAIDKYVGNEQQNGR